MADDSPRVQVESREEWRAWLTENHEKSDGIWLVTFKKAVREKYFPYEEIVQEALCFGWIDSLPRKLDEERTMLYLCPRRKGSPWSGVNKRHIEKMIDEGLMTDAGRREIEKAKEDGSWAIYDEIEQLVMPPDLADAFAKNETAKGHWDGFSDSSKKGILWWIKSAKRAATREKRIAETVRLAEENIKANHPQGRNKG